MQDLEIRTKKICIKKWFGCDFMNLKVFNYIATISCIITIILLYIFIIINDSFYLNGCTILMFLLLLLNPVSNLFKVNKKIINNPIFHMLIILLVNYISYTLINSIINFDEDKIKAYNMFYDKLSYLFVTTIIILLITFLFKKDKIKSNKDNSKIMLLIILITSIIPILTHSSLPLISIGFNIALFVFTIITFLKLKLINTTDELRGYYLILIVCSLISINPASLILSMQLFLQLDIFGVNI